MSSPGKMALKVAGDRSGGEEYYLNIASHPSRMS